MHKFTDSAIETSQVTQSDGLSSTMATHAELRKHMSKAAKAANSERYSEFFHRKEKEDDYTSIMIVDAVNNVFDSMGIVSPMQSQNHQIPAMEHQSQLLKEFSNKFIAALQIDKIFLEAGSQIYEQIIQYTPSLFVLQNFQYLLLDGLIKYLDASTSMMDGQRKLLALRGYENAHWVKNRIIDAIIEKPEIGDQIIEIVKSHVIHEISSIYLDNGIDEFANEEIDLSKLNGATRMVLSTMQSFLEYKDTFSNDCQYSSPVSMSHEEESLKHEMLKSITEYTDMTSPKSDKSSLNISSQNTTCHYSKIKYVLHNFTQGQKAVVGLDIDGTLLKRNFEFESAGASPLSHSFSDFLHSESHPTFILTGRKLTQKKSQKDYNAITDEEKAKLCDVFGFNIDGTITDMVDSQVLSGTNKLQEPERTNARQAVLRDAFLLKLKTIIKKAIEHGAKKVIIADDTALVNDNMYISSDGETNQIKMLVHSSTFQSQVTKTISKLLQENEIEEIGIIFIQPIPQNWSMEPHILTIKINDNR